MGARLQRRRSGMEVASMLQEHSPSRGPEAEKIIRNVIFCHMWYELITVLINLQNALVTLG